MASILYTHLIKFSQKSEAEGGGEYGQGSNYFHVKTTPSLLAITACRQLTMPLRKLDDEFLRTFLCQNQSHRGPGSLKSAEECVLYTAIKPPSVTLMGTLWL